jgi:hypothetical protein
MKQKPGQRKNQDTCRSTPAEKEHAAGVQAADVRNIVGEDVNRVSGANAVVDVIKEDVGADSTCGCVCASGKYVCDVRWHSYVQRLMK